VRFHAPLPAGREKRPSAANRTSTPRRAHWLFTTASRSRGRMSRTDGATRTVKGAARPPPSSHRGGRLQTCRHRGTHCGRGHYVRRRRFARNCGRALGRVSAVARKRAGAHKRPGFFNTSRLFARLQPGDAVRFTGRPGIDNSMPMWCRRDRRAEPDRRGPFHLGVAKSGRITNPARPSSSTSARP